MTAFLEMSSAVDLACACTAMLAAATAASAVGVLEYAKPFGARPLSPPSAEAAG